MRGESSYSETLFSTIRLDDFVPANHPLRAIMLQVQFSIRSERHLVEQINYNLLFGWFVGLSIDNPGLLSGGHFSVDGTLINAWASRKSMRHEDGSDDDRPLKCPYRSPSVRSACPLKQNKVPLRLNDLLGLRLSPDTSCLTFRRPCILCCVVSGKAFLRPSLCCIVVRTIRRNIRGKNHPRLLRSCKDVSLWRQGAWGI